MDQQIQVGLQEGMLALWVTNRERLRRFVEAELLPAWGLVLAAEWFWLKVTARGALVTPLVRLYLAACDVPTGLGRMTLHVPDTCARACGVSIAWPDFAVSAMTRAPVFLRESSYLQIHAMRCCFDACTKLPMP